METNKMKPFLFDTKEKIINLDRRDKFLEKSNST